MESIDSSIGLETSRMELRGVIRQSSEVLAQYWPMRTFVHHNPLHSLEYLPFDEAVRRGKQFLGGNGYLSSHLYRGYLRSGRIQIRHLDAALTPLVQDKHMTIGSHKVSHGEVLRACLAEGLCEKIEEPLDLPKDHEPHHQPVDWLAGHLASVLTFPDLSERISANAREGQDTLGRWITPSRWCDQTLGTQIVSKINSELIKWCEAFLDEGHAAWPMPGREKGLYQAWKALAAKEWSPCGIADSRRKISHLSDYPEDALLESLDVLAMPTQLRQNYLTLQLTELPGWAGFIKWRTEQREYEWQLAYPVDLVQYLAIRLWYARELAQKACHEELGIDGQYQAITAYMEHYASEYFLRKERVAGHLPAAYAEEVDRLCAQKRNGWGRLIERYRTDVVPRQERAAQLGIAKQLRSLARALHIEPAALVDSSPTDLKQLVDWMEAFPESEHGPVWLKAFEAGYQERLLGDLARNLRSLKVLHGQSSALGASEGEDHPAKPDERATRTPGIVRPRSQSVFCIDVRSEPFRRHLESTGMHETYGFAGFFAAFIRYQAWGKEHDTDQFPVIVRAKNEVREIPRNFLDNVVLEHSSRTNMIHAGHTLLHDLKENVVTPYVMVESVGWFYGLPIFGKTLLPGVYRRWTAWLQRILIPSLATTLTVDKLTQEETEEMLAYEQGTVIRRALREQFSVHGSGVTPKFVEALRQRALNREGAVEPFLYEAARRVGLSKGNLTEFVEVLRRDYQINHSGAAALKERITRTGFTLEEQMLTVDTALRMMGLTNHFARLVLFCGHGSTTENNPFESALDCGACGGNEGKPNARVLAMMANNKKVREHLAKNDIAIPSDTHFLAGQVDTTTDEVQLFDLEDAPPTHREDIAQLLEDLKKASWLTSQERCTRLPDVATTLPAHEAASLVHERSVDWSQVRPEWGLSGNTAFIVGRRDLTKSLDLGGRVFLHSYDYREDPTDRLLQVLMTAPQVVAQWINMEHYFSVVDNEVYGGGSKIYHNVVGRIGIMSGPWSDLRLGLAWQTMMSGDVPYHEPMRLLTVIEAPRLRIEKLIERHEVLQHFYHNEWVHLVVLEPEEGVLYRYRPTGEWSRVAQETGSP